MALLECSQVSKHFGGLKALEKVSLSIEEGNLVGLIGPNGAGKTTLFNLITGFLRATSGKIAYQGRDITSCPPHVLASMGLVRTFQKINVFGHLSVLDNVITGHHLQKQTGLIGALFQSRKFRREEASFRRDSLAILDSIGLGKWENYSAKDLPLGLQRALGIAVALAAKPRLLLLDEPASGMNSEESYFIMELIRKVHKSGITVLIVEHDMSVIMNLCQRIVVLDFGKVVAEGTPEGIQHDPQVIEVYLGKGFDNAAEIA